MQDKAAAVTFGTEGAEWHWQDGGVVEVVQKTVTLALHDLTGFAGRCDALLFTAAGGAAPPNGLATLAPLRRGLARRRWLGLVRSPHPQHAGARRRAEQPAQQPPRGPRTPRVPRPPHARVLAYTARRAVWKAQETEKKVIAGHGERILCSL
jgi:hypothetical protein